MKKLISTAALLIALNAGAYKFTHITTDNSGLSYDGISKITQDSRGFIWIGTYKGLNRYDGTAFKAWYKDDLGLISDFIHSIEEDRDGNLWIGTDNGVTKYDYLTDSFEPLAKVSDKGTVIKNKVTLISVDGPVVWMFVNDQGVFRYDTESDELRNIPYDEIGISGLRKMLKNPDGSFWVSRYHSNLYRADKDFRKISPIELTDAPDYFADDEIEGLFPAPGNKLYVASIKNGVSEVDPARKTVRNLFRLPRESMLRDAFMESGGILWLSTTHGIWRFDTETGLAELYSKNNSDTFSISNDYIYCSFVDRDGGLWVGTKDGGVNYSGQYQNNFEKQYLIGEESMAGILISGFAEDSGENIWISTEQQGLLRYDPRTGRIEKTENADIPKRIYTLCHDDGTIWFGSGTGLYRLDTKTLEVTRYGALSKKKGTNDPNIYMLFRSREGDLYAGTTLGVFRYDRANDKFDEIELFDGIYTTYAAEERESGRIWFSTYASGLICYDPESGEMPAHYHSGSGCGLPNDKIASVFISRKGDIWAVGFSNGISKLDRESGTFTVYDSNSLPMLASDVFFKALEDEGGSLWLASDSGLIEFNPNTLAINRYTELDGLLDSKFTNSALLSSSGKMYFGSNNGFISFDPASLSVESDIPRIVLTSMHIGEREVRFDRNIDIVSDIVLRHDENTFGFGFSILELAMPSQSRIQCRLDGYEENWRDLFSNKSVFYYNVPSGQYKFLIRAQPKNGDWVEAHAPILITLKPKFLESTAGILLLLFLAAGFMAAVTAGITYRSRRKQEMEEKAYRRAKDEETLQEKLNFFSHVIHEIKTPLTLIRTPLSNVMSKNALDAESKHDLEVMQNNTGYLTKLVNELLDFVRIEKAGYVLKCEDFDIISRIQSTLFDFSDTAKSGNLKLSFSSELSHAIVHADSVAVDKILNNLLINAVKYAETTISVTVSKLGDKVEIRFINDGPMIPEEYREEIFKPFVQYHDETKNVSSGVGIGLPLSRNLARMHSGDIELDHAARGTCFVLTLPMKESGPNSEEPEDAVKDKDPERECLLIVDDNKEFREYLAMKLGDTYDTVIAPDGQAAIEILKEQNVDMLLTDISMPVKSGLELCREIRNDIEISHIPIVILSARASVESKIQAMQAGADLYLEKPFDLEYLRSSIKNFLDRRMLMKNAFSNGLLHTDIDIFGLPKKDEEFFAKFDSVIKSNLSNSELSNEFLAEHLNMSQSTLSRKIRKLLNTSPNNYIRSIRLSAAAEMLKNSQGNNITEICYTVGFSNVSYFAKCFREQYGMTPTEYMAHGKQ